LKISNNDYKYFAFILAFITAIFSGCGKSSQDISTSAISFVSYRDIPGVTQAEIDAVEALKTRYGSFICAVNQNTDSFIDKNGEPDGFAILFYDWLSSLFGIPFEPVFYEWDTLMNGITNGEIDFTIEMADTPERRTAFFLTSPIVQRAVKLYRIAGSESITNIIKTRKPRYAFLNEVAVNSIANAGYDFEINFVDSHEAAYPLLERGEIDAYISLDSTEAVFMTYGGVISENFFPLSFRSSSLLTRKIELQPVISVMDKALDNSTFRFLAGMRDAGYNKYLENKLYSLLTEDELLYIRNSPVIPIGAEHGNYPISFFDDAANQWKGIYFDVLDEITKLTGITFKIANSHNAELPELLNALEKGETRILGELFHTEENKGRFLWSDVPLLEDNFALITRTDFHNIEIGEISHLKIGSRKSTIYSELFKKMFPDNNNYIEFNTVNDGWEMLKRGEIDGIFTNRRRLLFFTHYYEDTSYKLNLLFNYLFDSTFGYNRESAILKSIIDKTLSIIRIDNFTSQWMDKTFDYHQQLMEAQRPWFFGSSAMLILILALTGFLLYKSRNTGKKLEKLVRQRTEELEHETTALRATEEELRNASRAKSNFLANVSHEIRTPLNVVIGLTDLLLEDSYLPNHAVDNLLKISNAGNTLISIVNDILDFSKIESGKLSLRPVEYYLSSLLNDVTMLVVASLGEKLVSFNLDIDDNLPAKLYGDDLRVKQIFGNLLSNAVKYTAKGSIKLSVRCTREEGAVWMDVTISDTGIGIRKENLKKLFTEYYQADSHANRAIEGTGLGLSITKRLIEIMGGNISVESEYGKGSSFHFQIRQGFVSIAAIGPVIANHLRNFRYAEDKCNGAKKLVRVNLSYARVLVVDDMQTNLDVAAGLLRKYKMHIDCLLTGREAVDRIRHGAPLYNAVFMDHMMPDMDGIETTAAIRGLGTEYAEKIPIIALTANAVQGVEKMFYEHGFQAFLSKPIDLMELDSIIRKWIRDEDYERSALPDAQVEVIVPLDNKNITIDIPGVDTDKGLSLYAGEMNIYLPLLRSYVANTPVIMNRLRDVSEETLPDYIIAIHGLKGTSAGIGAETIQKAALNLETLSKAGNLAEVLIQNDELINNMETVVANIKAWLDQYDASNLKPRLKNPDAGILSRLRQCCENYNMSGIDKAIAELESFDYDEGAELVAWLKGKIDVSKLKEVAERLAEEEL
jgi:signal transduction histidine kinase/DNA-binding response OmpR family regulator